MKRAILTALDRFFDFIPRTFLFHKIRSLWSAPCGK
jgi:hypothetical protein